MEQYLIRDWIIIATHVDVVLLVVVVLLLLLFLVVVGTALFKKPKSPSFQIASG